MPSATTGGSGVDYFLQFTKAQGNAAVVGESQDAAFPKAIDVLSWNWSFENAATIGSATSGAGGGKAKFEPFVFRTVSNVATAPLAQIAASGAHFSKVVLSCRKAGGGQQVFLTITFHLVFITKFSMSGDESSTLPVDEYECHFGSFEISYKPQKPDGSLDAATKGAWNQVLNNTNPTI